LLLHEFESFKEWSINYMNQIKIEWTEG
jgi:hypothetical protein